MNELVVAECLLHWYVLCWCAALLTLLDKQLRKACPTLLFPFEIVFGHIRKCETPDALLYSSIQAFFGNGLLW